MAGIYKNLSCIYRRYQRNSPYRTLCIFADDCRKDAPNFGEAKNSWLTGTAAWTFLDVSQYILGIRPDYDGLTVDPCIPSTLDGFEAKRDFRGVTYHISVRNPKHVEKGVASMTVDGVAVDGNTIPLPTGKTEVSVEVVMG